MAQAIDLAAILGQLPELDPARDEKDRKGQPTKNRTDEFKLTGPAWEKAEKIYDAVFSAGKEAIVELIGMVGEGNDPAKYRPRYLLHGMVVYACRPGKQAQRAMLIEAFTSQLGGDQPNSTKLYLVRELEVCGNGSATAALGKLLLDEVLGDAAAKALTTIKDGAAEQLRTALGSAAGRRKLTIVQALGVLKDTPAVAALKAAAGDGDAEVKLAAAWALANIGEASAVDAVLAVADGEGWQRTKGTQAALVLAENLAAAGDKAGARKVYEHLPKTRAEAVGEVCEGDCGEGDRGIAVRKATAE